MKKQRSRRVHSDPPLGNLRGDRHSHVGSSPAAVSFRNIHNSMINVVNDERHKCRLTWFILPARTPVNAIKPSLQFHGARSNPFVGHSQGLGVSGRQESRAARWYSILTRRTRPPCLRGPSRCRRSSAPSTCTWGGRSNSRSRALEETAPSPQSKRILSRARGPVHRLKKRTTAVSTDKRSRGCVREGREEKIGEERSKEIHRGGTSVIDDLQAPHLLQLSYRITQPLPPPPASRPSTRADWLLAPSVIGDEKLSRSAT